MGFQVLFIHKGNQAWERWSALQHFCGGVLQRLKAAGALQNASGPGLAGAIASEFPICQGSGCLGASPASARKTSEVLLRVTSRDKGTDIGVSVSNQVAEACAQVS